MIFSVSFFTNKVENDMNMLIIALTAPINAVVESVAGKKISSRHQGLPLNATKIAN